LATQTYYMTGKAAWAKLFERNRDRAEFHEETDGVTSINILLEKEDLDKLKATGSRLRPMVTDDGLAVKFKRPWVHKGGIEDFGGAPQVVDKDGNDWDDSIAIGNDSMVEVAFEVYDTTMGKGTRLTGVKVLELVVFEGDGESRHPALPF